MAPTKNIWVLVHAKLTVWLSLVSAVLQFLAHHASCYNATLENKFKRNDTAYKRYKRVEFKVRHSNQGKINDLNKIITLGVKILRPFSINLLIKILILMESWNNFTTLAGQVNLENEIPTQMFPRSSLHYTVVRPAL